MQHDLKTWLNISKCITQEWVVYCSVDLIISYIWSFSSYFLDSTWISIFMFSPYHSGITQTLIAGVDWFSSRKVEWIVVNVMGLKLKMLKHSCNNISDVRKKNFVWQHITALTVVLYKKQCLIQVTSVRHLECTFSK